MTGRGSKELAGGKRLHLIVAIAYGKGVVLKVPYEKMSGGFFEKFVRQHFNLCFAKCGPKRTVIAFFSWTMTPHKQVKLHDKQCKILKLSFTKFQPDHQT